MRFAITLLMTLVLCLPVWGQTTINGAREILGTLTPNGLVDIGTVETFSDLDTTPDVSTGAYWKTFTNAITITNFDGTPLDGQLLYVLSEGAVTYDCTTSLDCGTTNLATAAGDVTVWLYDGTNTAWDLLSWKDESANMTPGSGGGFTPDADPGVDHSGFAGGDGIIETAGSIAVDLNATLDGVGSASSLSGMEITATAELALLQGCADNQILKWEDTGATWDCAADSGGAEVNDLESVATSAGDAEIFVGTGVDAGAYITGLAACAADEKIEYVPGAPDTFTCEAIGNLVDADIGDIALGTGTSGNYVDDVTAGTGIAVTHTPAEGSSAAVAWSFSDTLAGNPALNAEECVASTDGTSGGGFLCEGTAANTNEQLYIFPAVDGADTTSFIAVDDKQVTNLEGTGLSISGGTLNAHDIFAPNADPGVDHSGFAGGDGIIETAGSIAVDLNATLDGTGSTSNLSGMEFTATAELALLQGCADNQVLKWEDTGATWDCAADATGGSINSFETWDAPAGTDPVADSSTDTVTLTDGIGLVITGTAGTDTVDLSLDYSNTLGGNPALLANECVFISALQGFICEGTTANTNEQVFAFPADDAADASKFIAVDDTSVTDIEGNGLVITSNTLGIDLNETLDGTGSAGNLSGLEVTATNELALIQGCTDNFILKWEDTGATWDCAADDDVPDALEVASGAYAVASIDGDDINSNIGGNGIELVAGSPDTLAVDLNATLDGAGSTGNLSGMEFTATSELALLQGCSDNQIIKWDEAGATWNCEADAGGTSNSFETWDVPSGSDPVADSATDTVTFTDGIGLTISGVAASDLIDISFDYSNTLAGNPGLVEETCVKSNDGTGGGGFLCEGTTANANEQLYLFPAVDGADTTNFIVVDDTQTTSIEGRSLAVSAGVLGADDELYRFDKTMIIERPKDADNFLFFRVEADMTIDGIDCLSDGGTSTVITVQECDANGGTCGTTEAAITCATTNTTEAAGIDDSAIDATDWMRIDVGAVTGNVNHVAIHVTGTRND